MSLRNLKMISIHVINPIEDIGEALYWLDQAYFGVVGLHNYGYHEEAYGSTHKLIHNAEGVLAIGTSIRENYHPIT